MRASIAKAVIGSFKTEVAALIYKTELLNSNTKFTFWLDSCNTGERNGGWLATTGYASDPVNGWRGSGYEY